MGSRSPGWAGCCCGGGPRCPISTSRFARGARLRSARWQSIRWCRFWRWLRGIAGREQAPRLFAAASTELLIRVGSIPPAHVRSCWAARPARAGGRLRRPRRGRVVRAGCVAQLAAARGVRRRGHFIIATAVMAVTRGAPTPLPRYTFHLEGVHVRDHRDAARRAGRRRVQRPDGAVNRRCRRSRGP